MTTWLTKKETREKMFIGTWKLRGSYSEGTLKTLLKEMRKYSVDILVIPETTQLGYRTTEDVTFFKSSRNKRRFGMGFLVASRNKDQFKNSNRFQNECV